MAEKNTTKEGHQKKTGLAGKKHWIERKVLKRSTIDVVVTQNEKGTSEDSTVSSEQHTDLSTASTWSSEPWNTSVDQSPNQLKPLAAEGSDYNRLGENERQQMKQIKSQHMETSNERHATEHVSRSPHQPHTSTVHQPANTRDVVMMEFANEPVAAGHVQPNQKKQKPVTQSLMPSVGITSDNSPQSLPGNIEEELSRLEAERDHYKRESEGKEQTIQQYQQELIQYKTKLRQYTCSQQKQPHEDETSQLKVKELVEEQLKVKETELKQKYENDLQKKLETEKQKHEEDFQKKLTQKEQELQQRNDNDMRNKEQLIEQLKNKFTAETTKAADAIAKLNVLEQQLKNNQTIKKEQEQAKNDSQQKLAELKTQTELAEKRCKQLEEEKQKKEVKVQDLEKDKEDRKIIQDTLEARVKHLQEVLCKQKELDLVKDTELEQEREDKMRIVKENEHFKNESKQTAIQAAERTKRLEEQLADKEQEVNKLTAIIEERSIAQKEELEKVNRQLEEFKIEKLQDGIEDGAKATPNNSLSDLDKLKVTLNLKDEEIQDLNEKIRKLEEEKRTAQHERDTEHALIVSQLDEVWKEKQDLEIEQEDLKRLSATHNDALVEIRDLKQRLFEKERKELLQQKDEHLSGLIRLHKTQKNELHEKLQMYKTELEFMSKATKKESAELQTKIERLKVENGELQQELSEAKKVLHETQRVYLTTEIQKNQLETARVDIEEVKKVNTDLSDKTRQLEKENISLQQQLKTIKKEADDETLEVDYDKLTGEMSHKEIELQDMRDLLEEKGKTIQTLMESAEEKSKTVKALRGQVATAANQLNETTEAINSKQKEIVELKEKLEVKEIQREEQVAEWEEEKLVLTSQVNGYSRQCDELKKTLLQIQNKCKSLEDQLKHKTGLETEIDQLKSQLQLQHKVTEIEKLQVRTEKKSETEIHQLKIEFQQKESEMKALIHQKDSEINSLNVKCSETEKDFRKTESFVTQLQQELQSEYVDKQYLLSAFRQEQAKVANLENEMIKMRNANKILMEKALNQTKIPSGSGHNVGYPSATNILQRRNYPHQSTSEGYPVQQAMNVDANIMVTLEEVHVNKEHFSGSYDLPPPQMNIEQMREFGRRYDNQQREQQDEQWRRQQMEQQRQIEQARADKELEQLKLEQKRMEVKKHSPSQCQDIQYYSAAHLPYNDSDIHHILLPNENRPITNELSISDIGHFHSDIKDKDIVENISSPNEDRPITSEVQQSVYNPSCTITQEMRDLYYRMSERPTTQEMLQDRPFNPQLPYDPNLVCPKCGEMFCHGEIQKFKRHVEEFCKGKKYY